MMQGSFIITTTTRFESFAHASNDETEPQLTIGAEVHSARHSCRQMHGSMAPVGLVLKRS